MKNHYHLLVSERLENGITKFLRKVNIGYANYFNDRHEKIGSLFRGRTRKVPVTDPAHFHHVVHYIHLNLLDYLEGTQLWRNGTIADASSALDHLLSYRWSSLLDYVGHANFPSIVYTDFYKQSHPEYKKDISKYVANLGGVNLQTLQDLWGERNNC